MALVERTESKGTRTLDFDSADGCRKALAMLTAQFLAQGDEADVPRFRAVVAALEAILSDYARQAAQDVESDIAELDAKLRAWEGDQ